ncbi:MAG: TonB-dependent receptor [Bacteroidota bacterium]|nr:TonB-dependent receptor [Bacteroidota bacterium]
MKKLTGEKSFLKRKVISKSFLIMRLTLYLILFSVFQSFASAYSQTANITLKLHNASIEQVFKTIQGQTEFDFFYKNEQIPAEKRISINVRNAKIEEVLQTVFNGTNLGYKVFDKDIVISLKKSETGNMRAPAIQKKRVTGKVTNASGAVLAGVSVLAKGTNSGAVSDINGNYSIEVPEGVKSVIFSFIGMISQEIPIGSKSSINVVMHDANVGLDEVVAVGYGVQKKVNLTGAVGQVGSKALVNRPIPNAAVGLQGLIPNLNITVSSGRSTETPSFNIRGITSLNGGQPLIVIDDEPSTVEELMRLTPTDIESVSTLMDAASASIYGARAAFGVVLVTTKNAKKEGMSVDVGTNTSFRTPIRIPKFIMAPDTVIAIKNLGGGGWYTYDGAYEKGYLHKVAMGQADAVRINPNNPNLWQYAGSTNWYDEAMKKYGISQNHDIAISGKNQRINYYFSGAYYRQEGMFKYGNDIYDKYNIRGKMDFKLTNWFTLSNNTSYIYSVYDEPSQGISMNNLYSTPSTDVPKNPDGSWTYSGASVFGALQEGGRATNKVSSYNTSFTGKLDVIKDLWSITGRASFIRSNTDYRTFSLPIDYKYGPEYSSVMFPVTYAEHDAYFNTQNVFDLYTDLDKKIGKNYFHVMAGYNQEYRYSSYFWGSRKDLISTSVPSIRLGTGDQNVGEWISDFSTRSGFYRVNYSYDDKYLIESNGRYDGTSRFRKDSRFGFFPSLSLGWNIHKEGFFKPLSDVVSQLKPRFSYGKLGNQDVSDYNYLPFMSSGKTGSIIQGQTLDQQTTVYAPGLVSGDLTWEKVRTTNYGVDFGILDNRLSSSFDYYHRATLDMLIKSKTLPSVLGTAEPRMNAADLMTKGWELSVAWNDQFNFLSSPFKYGLRVTLADSRTWVTKYDNPNGNLADYFEGYEIGTIYGFHSTGLFQSPSELKNHANQSAYWTYPEKITPGPGDIRFEDLNGDGVIRPANTVYDMQDSKIIGNSHPRYQTSYTLNCSWQGFDMNAFFQGVLKQDYYPTDIYFWASYQSPWTNTQVYQIDNMWTPNRRDAYLPRIKGYAASTWSGHELGWANDRYIQNAAYVRLKNMTIGYTLSDKLFKKVCEKMKLNSARIYVSGENLLTWTGIKNKNLDPETLGNYPLQKTYSFGLNVSF